MECVDDRGLIFVCWSACHMPHEVNVQKGTVVELLAFYYCTSLLLLATQRLRVSARHLLPMCMHIQPLWMPLGHSVLPRTTKDAVKLQWLINIIRVSLMFLASISVVDGPRMAWTNPEREKYNTNEFVPSPSTPFWVTLIAQDKRREM